MVIGGEPPATSTCTRGIGSFNGAADGDRRRGRDREREEPPRRRASTEPPMVIGGEAVADEPDGDAPPASTEPPMVIGGEGSAAAGTSKPSGRLQRSRRW